MKTVAKGVRTTAKKLAAQRKKAGSSNAGKYPSVKPSEFAGAAGGAAPTSFPINTLKRARSALSLAHNAPNPSGIRKKVMAKFPSLRKKGRA